MKNFIIIVGFFLISDLSFSATHKYNAELSLGLGLGVNFNYNYQPKTTIGLTTQILFIDAYSNIEGKANTYGVRWIYSKEEYFNDGASFILTAGVLRASGISKINDDLSVNGTADIKANYIGTGWMYSWYWDNFNASIGTVLNNYTNDITVKSGSFTESDSPLDGAELTFLMNLGWAF
jgi:hypothetical protein